MVFCVALKRVAAVHSAEHFGCVFPPKQAERLVDGMGPCIEQTAAPQILSGLPIPSPPEPAPRRPDVNDFAQNTRGNHFLYFVKKWLQPIVLEGKKHALIPVGRLNNTVEIRDRARVGLLTNDVVARIECGNTRIDVQRRRQRIDK